MPKIILDKKLFSLQEVADLLGVSRSAVAKYTRAGRLETVTIGGRKYCSEENIKAFLTRPE